MRLILFLLLAACAFGQASEPICSAHPWAKLYPVKGFCGLCYQDSINAAKFADIEKRLKALEKPVQSAPPQPTHVHNWKYEKTNETATIQIGDTTVWLKYVWCEGCKRFAEDILREKYPDDPTWAKLDAKNHGRFYPILSKVRSDSVVERKHGRFYCDLAGHSWAWGDTTYWKSKPLPSLAVYSDNGYMCPAICRTCLADTLAVWSYAEDQQRKQAAKKLTEYEMLKQQKERK